MSLTLFLTTEQEGPFGRPFEELFNSRIQEADEFYNSIVPAALKRDSLSKVYLPANGLGSLFIVESQFDSG